MPNMLKNLHDLATGRINEDTYNAITTEDPDDLSQYEEDEEFMQECMAYVVPAMMQAEILGESSDEAIIEAYLACQNYLVGQGIISEAASVPMTNPKINVVRLNKAAQINRLTTIITLKMARRDNAKSYQKYKLGQKIKKTNMEEMRKRYGAKAERLAKKLYQKAKKPGKVAAVVDTAKEHAKK